MGGKSIAGRAMNVRQRKKMATFRMKDLMEERASVDKNPPFMGEVICKSCGFKARYQFLRCPECNEVQK